MATAHTDNAPAHSVRAQVLSQLFRTVNLVKDSVPCAFSEAGYYAFRLHQHASSVQCALLDGKQVVRLSLPRYMSRDCKHRKGADSDLDHIPIDFSAPGRLVCHELSYARSAVQSKTTLPVM